MRLLLCAVLVVWHAGDAMAQDQTADPRAFEGCKKQNANFVAIANCLPDAHLAVKTLDAFDRFYPPTAQPLKQKCLELNKDELAPSGICVMEAINKAIELKKSLPNGSSLSDPVFDAVSDEGLLTKVTAEQEKAMAAFPQKKTFWVGTAYQPYR